jgi:hypothetical protein
VPCKAADQASECAVAWVLRSEPITPTAAAQLCRGQRERLPHPKEGW